MKRSQNFLNDSSSHGRALASLLSALACLSLLAVSARAGSLQPSASPAGTMRTLLEVSSKDSGNTFDRSTDSLEAVRDRSDLLAPASTALSSSAWTSRRIQNNRIIRHLADDPIICKRQGFLPRVFPTLRIFPFV